MKDNRKTEYKMLSKKAKSLLAREEDYDVDWKRDMSGFHSEDIVAFANSTNGGSILIGIAESSDSAGRQIPEIVGCSISDGNKMSINTKAQNCIPPVELNIIAENTANKPIYRIEIPSGGKKPYCTRKGIYKIRDDGNNRGITPDKLLKIFIEEESDIFLERFKTAAKELEGVLYDASEEINEVKSYLEDIMPEVEGLQEYSYMSDEILGVVNNMDDYVQSTEITTGWNEKRILLLLDHFDIEDPFVSQLKNMFKHSVTRMSENGVNIRDKDFLKEMKVTYHGATEEQLKQWHSEVIEEMKLN